MGSPIATPPFRLFLTIRSSSGVVSPKKATRSSDPARSTSHGFSVRKTSRAESATFVPPTHFAPRRIAAGTSSRPRAQELSASTNTLALRMSNLASRAVRIQAAGPLSRS
jgi:hypothetical protein